MLKDRRIVVIGAGGHAKVLIDALQLLEFDIVAILDADETKAGQRVLGIEVAGSDRELGRYGPQTVRLVNGIGSIGRPSARSDVFERFRAAGYEFATVQHPAAIVSKDAQLGGGAQIMAGSIVQPGSEIGQNSIVNTRASVDHDCRIGAHVHVAPGAILCGGVSVGALSHIGSGAIVVQGISIGSGCLIKAGAIVTSDVPDRSTVHNARLTNT